MDGWGRGELRSLGVGEKRIKLLVGEEVSAFHLSGTSPARLCDDPAPGHDQAFVTRPGFWDTIRLCGYDQAFGRRSG